MKRANRLRFALFISCHQKSVCLGRKPSIVKLISQEEHKLGVPFRCGTGRRIVVVVVIILERCDDTLVQWKTQSLSGVNQPAACIIEADITIVGMEQLNMLVEEKLIILDNPLSTRKIIVFCHKEIFEYIGQYG